MQIVGMLMRIILMGVHTLFASIVDCLLNDPHMGSGVVGEEEIHIRRDVINNIDHAYENSNHG